MKLLPIMPGGWLLLECFPDEPAPGWTSEKLQISSKTDHRSNPSGSSKSTLCRNVEMAKKVGGGKESVRLWV